MSQTAANLDAAAMSKPIRILYVHNSADFYGASRSLLRLLPEVRQRGHQALVVLPADGPLRERIQALGVNVIVDRWLSVIARPTFRAGGVVRFLLGFPISVGK